jgi:hypothetical protein
LQGSAQGIETASLNFISNIEGQDIYNSRECDCVRWLYRMWRSPARDLIEAVLKLLKDELSRNLKNLGAC